MKQPIACTTLLQIAASLEKTRNCFTKKRTCYAGKRAARARRVHISAKGEYKIRNTLTDCWNCDCPNSPHHLQQLLHHFSAID